MKLFSKNSNLCDHNPPTSQTDGRTDDMRSRDRALHCCASRGNKINSTVVSLCCAGAVPLPAELEDGASEGNDSAAAAAPAAKKQRIDVADFEDDEIDERFEADEVSAYVQARVDASNRDILVWWKEHSHQFPKLATLARQLFAIPASSAASERSFSAAGYTVSERRTALSPDTVDNILFLHSNK